MATATEPRWLAGLEKLGEGSYRDPATGLDVVVGKTFWRRHTRVRFSGSDPFVRAMVIIKPRLRCTTRCEHPTALLDFGLLNSRRGWRGRTMRREENDMNKRLRPAIIYLADHCVPY